MSTIVTMIASWFGGSVLVALLIGRVMSFAKRNDPPEMPVFLPALVVPHPAFTQTTRIKRRA